MSCTETLNALGAWSLTLSPDTPDDVRKKLQFFGHVAIVRGDVDPDEHGDALLPRARYVGVLRQKGVGDALTLSGSGMVFWLGDEDGKGHVIETAVTLTSATLAAAVAAVLPPTVTVGTVHALTNPAARYTGRHIFQSPREALGIICDAFGVEFRVNGNATVDVGRPDQLYNTTAPDSVIVRKGAGADVDLTAVSGSYDTDQAVFDYSTRVLLLGQTTGDGTAPEETFATGSQDAPVVPYKDLRGNVVKLTRIISESGQTEGSVAARAQLQLNRFNRTSRSLSVDADQYQADGVFVVGDATYVYDPDAGVFDNAREVFFRGEALHPDLIRISSVTWPISAGHTVAFRTGDGAWVDLTRWVQWEGDSSSGGLGTGSLTEIIVGDLPNSLGGPSGNAVQDRVDAAQPNTGDASIPKTPTGLTLATTPAADNWGNPIAFLRASWAAVTQNTDNTAITDLSHYETRYRPQFRAPGWVGSALSDGLTVDIVAAPGLVYDVEVRAVDKAGNFSDWSGTASLTAAVDVAGPPSPADPLVSNYLGQLRIEYVGVDSAGFAMPSDAAAIEVYVGTSADFFPTADLKVADLSPFTRGHAYATAPYGSTRWVRLVAADAAGNRGPSSAAVAGTTNWVVSEDIANLAVGELKLADLAVARAKIANLAVNSAKIADLEVGKITAGTMNADVIIGGRFTTAAFGQRTEHNALGFEGWNASAQQTVRLNGYDNLLVGRFRSGLPGTRFVDIGVIGDLSTINLVAPDAQTAFLRAYTDTSSTRMDAVQLGIGVPSYTTSDAFGWNSLGYTQQETAFYRTKSHDFVYQTRFAVIEASNRASGTFKTRMQISPAGAVFNSGSTLVTNSFMSYSFVTGQFDLQWAEGSLLRVVGGLGGSSPVMAFANPGGLGLAIKANTDGGGTFMEVVNFAGDAYGGWRASSFNVTSDERGKTDIQDAVIDPLPAVRAARIRSYERVGGNGRTEIGLVAQEAAAVTGLAQVVSGDPDTGLSVDLYQLVVLQLAALKQVDKRLTAIETRAAK